MLKSLSSHLPCLTETLGFWPDSICRGTWTQKVAHFLPRTVCTNAPGLAQPLIYRRRLGSYQGLGRQTSTRQLDGCLQGSFFPPGLKAAGANNARGTILQITWFQRVFWLHVQRNLQLRLWSEGWDWVPARTFILLVISSCTTCANHKRIVLCEDIAEQRTIHRQMFAS